MFNIKYSIKRCKKITSKHNVTSELSDDIQWLQKLLLELVLLLSQFSWLINSIIHSWSYLTIAWMAKTIARLKAWCSWWILIEIVYQGWYYILILNEILYTEQGKVYMLMIMSNLLVYLKAFNTMQT